MTVAARSLEQFEPTEADWHELDRCITKEYKGNCWGWRVDQPPLTKPVITLGGRRISARRLTLYRAGRLETLTAPMAVLTVTCGDARIGPDYHECVNPDHVIIGYKVVRGVDSRAQKRRQFARQSAVLMHIKGHNVYDIADHLGYSDVTIRKMLTDSGEDFEYCEEQRRALLSWTGARRYPHRIPEDGR